jgi:hypothetical protein
VLEYFIGLDLGQAQDYSALVVLERRPAIETGNAWSAEDADNLLPLFNAVHLNRWPLGTKYPQIVMDIHKMLIHSAFKSYNTTLAIDGTGVGAAVVDYFMQADIKAELLPIQITGGNAPTHTDIYTRVPKRDLVGCVQVALQTARLKIASALPLASLLVSELQNFQVKITDAAHDVYGAWREGQHDDLVLALALALWAGMSAGSSQVSEDVWEVFGSGYR